MPEYREWRCCMCPNISTPDKITCPAVPLLHPDETPCRFVKCYIDERGWKYKVKPGFTENSFKARYFPPGRSPSGKCMKNLEWKNDFDSAQEDLNAYAKKKGWEEIENF